MNGRAYDYNLGRFLSVDPFVQAPGNSQSMNPYSYIMNNPLSGTDPSGYLRCNDGKSGCGAGTGWQHTQGYKRGSSKGISIALTNGAKVNINSSALNNKDISKAIEDIDLKDVESISIYDSPDIVGGNGVVSVSGGTNSSSRQVGRPEITDAVFDKDTSISALEDLEHHWNKQYSEGAISGVDWLTGTSKIFDARAQKYEERAQLWDKQIEDMRLRNAMNQSQMQVMGIVGGLTAAPVVIAGTVYYAPGAVGYMASNAPGAVFVKGSVTGSALGAGGYHVGTWNSPESRTTEGYLYSGGIGALTGGVGSWGTLMSGGGAGLSSLTTTQSMVWRGKMTAVGVPLQHTNRQINTKDEDKK